MNYKQFHDSYTRMGYTGNEVKCIERAPNCEICGKECQTVFDHDHVTGRFRGWLCHHCNIALGMAEDDVTILWRMIKYLMLFRKNTKSSLKQSVS